MRPSGLGEINISPPSSRRPCLLPKPGQVLSSSQGWEGLSYKRQECCDLPSRDRGLCRMAEGKAGRAPPSASGLCTLLTCPAESSTDCTIGMLAAPPEKPGKQGGGAGGAGQASRCLWQLLLRHSWKTRICFLRWGRKTAANLFLFINAGPGSSLKNIEANMISLI